MAGNTREARGLPGQGGPQRWVEGLSPGSHPCFPAVRSGFLRLAEALAFRGDSEVVSSTVRAVVTTLKSGEKCSVEPELVGKGTSGPGTGRTPSLAASAEVLLRGVPEMGAVERSGSLAGRACSQHGSCAWALLLASCARGEPTARVRAHRRLPWPGHAGALVVLQGPGVVCPGVRWSGACLSVHQTGATQHPCPHSPPGSD